MSIARAVKLPRLLLRPVLLLAVSLSFLAAYQQPAEAVPPPAPVQTASVPSLDDRNISASDKADLKAAASMARYAVKRKTNVMDYAKADAHDQGRTTARRKMAAGVLFGGGKLTHISKTELKKVKAYIPKNSNAISTQAVHCYGQTKSLTDVHGSAFWTQTWLNSCKTNQVILAIHSAAATAGVLAIFVEYTILAGVTAAALALSGEYLSYCQSNSDVSAVVINDHFHLVWCTSQ